MINIGSNTPFEASKYPGAGKPRICTAGYFRLKADKPVNFTVLNTHLDHRSDAQRQLGASLILTRAKYEAYATDGPVFVMGDFNSPSTGPDSGAYYISAGALPPVDVNATFAEKYAVPKDALPGFRMVDLRGAVPPSMVSGDFATFTAFKKPGDASSFSRIDFVFGANVGGWWVSMFLGFANIVI